MATRSPVEMLWAELRAQGLPVVTVYCGDLLDRATWRIDLDANATRAQIDQAESIRRSFDPDAQVVKDADLPRQRSTELWTPQLLALVTATHERTKGDGVSLDAFKQSVEKEFDTLLTPVVVAPLTPRLGIVARTMAFLGFGDNSNA